MDTISYWLDMAVENADPLEFDLSSHHVAFSGVLGTVINQYSIGKISPYLAESWTIQNDYKTWTFHLRKGLHFSNGDPLKSSDLARSWLRVAYLQKNQGSQSGLFEKLVGYEKLNSIDGPIPGLTYDDQSITLNFKEAHRFVLEKISFGLYSAVHPSNYDLKTGSWKKDTSVVSSGIYEIKEWQEKSLILSLRKDFIPSYGHQKKFKVVKIFWGNENKKGCDLWDGSNRDLEKQSDAHFMGSVNTSIDYIKILSWRNPNHFLSVKENRYVLREKMRQCLKHFNLPVAFFPMKKIIKPILPQADVINEHKETKRLFINRRSYELDYSHDMYQCFARVSQSLNLNYSEISNMLASEIRSLDDPTNPPHKYKLDLRTGGTDINIENPYGTIRFMFFSKEGIMLPDEDGSIAKILKEENFSVDEVNQKIEEQALIWPVAHFSYFFWYRGDFIDFSEYNTTLPPIDFSWIGRK